VTRGLAGTQEDVPEGGVVAAIGIALAFEAESGVSVIGMAGLADECAVERYAGVELKASLGCAHGEHTASAGLGESGDGDERGGEIGCVSGRALD
jgi:hypothetical protein